MQVVRRPSLTYRLAGALPAVLGLGVAVSIGLHMAQGWSLVAVALPVAALAGLVLVALAYSNFELFVLAVLVSRTALDLNEPASRSFEGPRGGSGELASVLGAMFVFSSFAWLVAQRREGRQPPWSVLTKAMVALVSAGLLSVAFSPRPLVSLAEVARMGGIMVMVLVLDRLMTDRTRVMRVLVACYASALLPLALGLYQVLGGGGAVSAGGFHRVRGTFVHPNSFGLYVALLVVMGLALYRHLAPRARPVMAVLLLVCMIELVATYSRGSWLACMAGVVTVGILQSRRLIAMALVGAIVVALAVPSVMGRVGDLTESRSARGTAGNTLVWRLDYWNQALKLVKKNPVSGIGLRMTQYSEDAARAPHNDLLRALVETGLVGLLAYLALLAALFTTARTAIRRSVDGPARGVAVGFAGCLASFVVASMGGNLMSQVVVMWYFVAFAAAALAVGRCVPGLRPVRPSRFTVTTSFVSESSVSESSS